MLIRAVYRSRCWSNDSRGTRSICSIRTSSIRPRSSSRRNSSSGVSTTAASTSAQGSTRGQVAVEIDAQSIRYEVQSSSLSARGSVTRQTGARSTLDLQATICAVSSRANRFRFMPARASRDPLVLDLSGAPRSSRPQKISFDVDADGVVDGFDAAGRLGAVGADRNGNGKIDDGSECSVRRPATVTQTLSALDSDHNGWIDSADPAFSQLRLWQPTADGGGQLETLQEGMSARSRCRTWRRRSPFPTRRRTPSWSVQSTGHLLARTGPPGRCARSTSSPNGLSRRAAREDGFEVPQKGLICRQLHMRNIIERGL